MSYQLFTNAEKYKQIEWLHKVCGTIQECKQWEINYNREKPHAYFFENGWFGPGDAEIYHYIIRHYQPKIIMEIGCGNTTKLAWNASMRNPHRAKIITIDPNPVSKVEMAPYSNKHYKASFEDIYVPEIEELQANDIFFIDSSHSILLEDVQKEFYVIWNQLPSGCLIHWHDIHLPYPYVDGYGERGYTEQYAILGLLESQKFEMLFANYWMWTQFREDLLSIWPSMDYMVHKTSNKNPLCGSFWIRKK